MHNNTLRLPIDQQTNASHLGHPAPLRVFADFLQVAAAEATAGLRQRLRLRFAQLFGVALDDGAPCLVGMKRTTFNENQFNMYVYCIEREGQAKTGETDRARKIGSCVSSSNSSTIKNKLIMRATFDTPWRWAARN